MKRNAVMVPVASWFLALAFVFVAGCMSDTNLSKVVICKSVDQEGKPLEKANNFVAGEKVFASVELIEVPKNTEVSVKWLKGSRLLRKEAKKTGRGSQPGDYPHIVFGLDTEKDWQLGPYKIEVELPFGAGTKVQEFTLEKGQ